MPSNKTVILLITVLVAVSGFPTRATPASAANKELLLHSFCRVNGCPDGVFPFGPLTFDSSGNLYGTTFGGGASGGYGTVFRLTPSTHRKWKEKVLHSFNLKDGGSPHGALVLDSSGNLYGTTSVGGAFYTCGGGSGCGTVFQLTPSADDRWKETVLHNFGKGTDGYYPGPGVTFDSSGNLYGTTVGGGAFGGYGTVFRLTPSAHGKWKEEVLHSFNLKDGGFPQGALVFDSSGNLYGTTYQGGGYNSSCWMSSCGVVFKLSLGKNGAWTENVLHRFNFRDGSQPDAGLTFDVAGNLYGTTYGGGAYGWCGGGSGCGTVFQLTPSADDRWKETVLHNFGKGKDGTEPQAGVILDTAGNLYGTTSGGGAQQSCGYDPCGTVFQLTPGGNAHWNEKVLHSFSGAPDGNTPEGSLIFDGAGKLYGAAADGGAYGGGAVFQITP